jgi:hypothetical protein
MSRTILDVLDESNPNKLPSGAQLAKLGSALGLLPRFASGAVSSSILVLPDDAKARVGLQAFATAGTTPGAKSFVIGTPATGQFSINALGNILFATVDAVTAAEVSYIPFEGEVFTEDLTVSASSAALSSGRQAVMLISAQVLTGLVPGTKSVSARGAAPSAGSAAINTLGTAIAFNATDVVAGTCRVTYVITPGTGGTTSLASRLAQVASF